MLPDPHHHHVLVVDDDPPCLDALVTFLEHAGFTTEGACSGEAALATLRNGGPPPCVVVTDVLMPDVDGWAMVEAMRADQKLAGLPVVMLSGLSNQVARALNLGVRAYLPKPVEPDAIVEAVARYCQRSAAPREGAG